MDRFDNEVYTPQTAAEFLRGLMVEFYNKTWFERDEAEDMTQRAKDGFVAIFPDDNDTAFEITLTPTIWN